MGSVLTALGLTGVTKLGWWVVGLAAAAALAAIGTLWALNASLSGRLERAGKSLGVVETAKVACEGTVKVLGTENAALAARIESLGKEVAALRDEGEKNAAEARARQQAVEDRAAEAERVAEWLMGKQRDRVHAPGAPLCVAAVQDIREALR